MIVWETILQLRKSIINSKVNEFPFQTREFVTLRAWFVSANNRVIFFTRLKMSTFHKKSAFLFRIFDQRDNERAILKIQKNKLNSRFLFAQPRWIFDSTFVVNISKTRALK